MCGVADFAADLAAECELSAWCGWENIYQAAFPTMTRCERETGLDSQRRGIDRTLYLGTVEVPVTVDEKYDSHTTGRFFLETASSQERPGWVMGYLACDFIGYLFKPERRFYLLPYQRLCAAWTRMGDGWTAEHGEKQVRNETWTTVGVTVPCQQVLAAIGGCVQILWDGRSWVRMRA